MLTNQEYVAKRGLHCPLCLRNNLSAYDPQVDDNAVWINACRCHRTVSCTDCGASWTEHYNLAGYSEMFDQDVNLVKIPD